MTKAVTRKMAVDALLYRLQSNENIDFENKQHGMGVELICPECKKPLLPGQDIQFDHAHGHAMGGPHEYQNLRPIHYDPCHKAKSKRDVAALAKVDRITGVTCNGPKRRIPTKPFTRAKRPFPKRAK